ncbi:MAG: hypothetical protein AB1742_11695 [bacterium]
MSDDVLRGIQRVRDVRRVHDTSRKEKREEKKKHDAEFRELLEGGVKETEPFATAPTVEIIEPVKTKDMLGHLSSSTAPPKIEPRDDKSEPGGEESGGEK